MDSAMKLDAKAMVKLFCTGISQLLSVKSSSYQRRDIPSGGKKRRFLAFKDTPETTISGPHSKNKIRLRNMMRSALLILIKTSDKASYSLLVNCMKRIILIKW
jgi:hypothetical protein